MQHGLQYLSVEGSMGRNGDGNGSHQRDLTEIIELYLTSCRIEGKSEETVRSYRESLGIFTNVIKEERLPKDPASFTTAHVYQFLGHVADTGVSAMTQWRRQREARAFFSWLLRHDHVATNPFSKVKNIKVPQKVIRPFSQEDVLRLLAWCDPSTHKGARDRALMGTSSGWSGLGMKLAVPSNATWRDFVVAVPDRYF
jgi:integrase/recombinase XerD